MPHNDADHETTVITFTRDHADGFWSVDIASLGLDVKARDLGTFALTDEDALKRILVALVTIARRDQRA
jgi:hypothetical protein